MRRRCFAAGGVASSEKGARRFLGVLLLILGILGVAAGGFSYKKEKGDAKIGPEVELTEKKRVDIPLWAGIAAIGAGGVLLIRKP